MDFNTELRIIEENEITEKEAYEFIKTFDLEYNSDCTINKIQIGEILRVLKIKLMLEDSEVE